MIVWVSLTRVVERDLRLRCLFRDSRVGLSILVNDVVDIGYGKPQEYPRKEFQRRVQRYRSYLINRIPDLSSPFVVCRSDLVRMAEAARFIADMTWKIFGTAGWWGKDMMVLYDRERVDEEHKGPGSQLLDGKLHRHSLRGAESPHLLDKVGREGVELLTHPEEEMIRPISLENDRHTKSFTLVELGRVDDVLLKGYTVRRQF